MSWSVTANVGYGYSISEDDIPYPLWDAPDEEQEKFDEWYEELNESNYYHTFNEYEAGGFFGVIVQHVNIITALKIPPEVDFNQCYEEFIKLFPTFPIDVVKPKLFLFPQYF